ncbi:MAG: hypothetical protein M1837_000309 [Sclerophora amabilis]|nr:MAG: hypothetical protein M1837_000309 [Sclerophora amabilis]
MDTNSALSCPFCEFTDHESYIMMLHVETLHSEGDSPFVVTESQEQEQLGFNQVAASNVGINEPSTQASLPVDSEEYVTCPESDCGEAILLAEIDTHIELHQAEKEVTEDSVTIASQDKSWPSEYPASEDVQPNMHFSTNLPEALRNRDSFTTSGSSSSSGTAAGYSSPGLVSYRGASRRSSRRKSQTGLSSPYHGPVKRLGKSELGPYAHEKQMPAWLRRQLEVGGMSVRNQIRQDGTLEKVTSFSNESGPCMPVVAQLCEQDSTVERAYLCHPGVRHVHKMNREGGFCGYRNIQMMISYIQEAETDGHEQFGKRTPSILHLQDLIEHAWSQGFNAEGRIETGGIKGTRKYIGTSEVRGCVLTAYTGMTSADNSKAQALFLSLDIPCDARAFGKARDSHPSDRLLRLLEAYFAGGSTEVNNGKVHRTWLPPVYLQHQGHSLTVVGIERRKPDSLNLLVFDPMFKPSPAFGKLIGTTFRHRQPSEALRGYRRGSQYLRRFNAFEILQ